MSRLHFDFGIGRHTCAGSLDTAPGTTGLLIVSGGNEIRAGAFSGQAQLAAHIAKRGFPVFRFDRRGIGDSEGENRGFRKASKDIRAALEAFRAMAPQIERVVGFGNCDAASALMLNGGKGFDALVLSNPWTLDAQPGTSPASAMPPGAIRARYSEKLKNPAELGRLLSGGVNLKKLASSVARSLKPSGDASGLSAEMHQGLEQFEGTARILLSTADRTAQLFAEAWDSDDPRIERCEGADHSFSTPEAQGWLREKLLTACRA